MGKKLEAAATNGAENATLASSADIESKLLEAQANIDNLRKQQTEILQNRKTEIEGLVASKRIEFQNALTALQNGFEAENNALNDELSTINGKLGIVVAPVASPVSATATASVFQDSDIPKGMTREAFSKITVVRFRPSSLDERLLMIFGNAGEGADLTIEALVIACKVTGHESKSPDIKPSISTALVRLKGDKKWIKSPSRGIYQVAAKGLKEFEKLVKTGEKPAYQGGAAGSENGVNAGKAMSLKNLGEYILVFAAEMNKTCERNEFVTGVISLGFKTEIKEPKALAASMQSSLKSLIAAGQLTEEKDESDGRKMLYTITTAGKAAAKQLTDAAKAA